MLGEDIEEWLAAVAEEPFRQNFDLAREVAGAHDMNHCVNTSNCPFKCVAGRENPGDAAWRLLLIIKANILYSLSGSYFYFGSLLE